MKNDAAEKTKNPKKKKWITENECTGSEGKIVISKWKIWNVTKELNMAFSMFGCWRCCVQLFWKLNNVMNLFSVIQMNSFCMFIHHYHRRMLFRIVTLMLTSYLFLFFFFYFYCRFMSAFSQKLWETDVFHFILFFYSFYANVSLILCHVIYFDLVNW